MLKHSAPTIDRDVVEELRMKAFKAQFSGPPVLKVTWKGRTVRALKSGVHFRPISETFHEFLIVILKHTIGKRWYFEQIALPDAKRHAIVRWIIAWHEQGRDALPPDHEPGVAYGVEPNAEALEAIILADDVFRLQQVSKLPGILRKRLRSRDGFQGVRYEIAIAATFVRCGFEISWLPPQSKPHAEFVAVHRATRETIVVETKSRHRSGVLHQQGSPPQLSELRADVGGLLTEALTKAPGDHPFAVFVDLNLPHNPSQRATEHRWIAELQALVAARGAPSPSNPDPFAFLGFTNLGWHYEGRGKPAPAEHMLVVPRWARPPLRNIATLQAIKASLDRYGRVPTEDNEPTGTEIRSAASP